MWEYLLGNDGEIGNDLKKIRCLLIVEMEPRKKKNIRRDIYLIDCRGG